MPPLPVALSGNVPRCAVRNVCAQQLGDVVHQRAERGVQVADRRLGERARTRWGTGEGPEPSSSRVGDGGGHGASMSGKCSVEVLAQDVADPRALVLRGDAEAREQLLLAA